MNFGRLFVCILLIGGATTTAGASEGTEIQRVTPDRVLDFGQDLWVELPDVADGDLGPPRLARRPGDDSGPFGVLLEGGASHTYRLEHRGNSGVQNSFASIRWSGIVAFQSFNGTWLELLDEAGAPALTVAVQENGDISVNAGGSTFDASVGVDWSIARRIDLVATAQDLRIWIDEQEASFEPVDHRP